MLLGAIGNDCLKIKLGANLACEFQGTDIKVKANIARVTTVLGNKGTVIRKFGVKFNSFEQGSLEKYKKLI